VSGEQRSVWSWDFRTYFVGQTLSRFGDSIAGIALAFAVLTLTRSATSLGLVLLASRAPVIALTLVGGVLGDRLSRRLIMLTTDAARTVIQVVAAVLLLTGHAHLWSLAALEAGAGVGTAMFNPAASGRVAELVPKTKLRQANSLLGISISTAQVTGVGAAGVLVAVIGPGSAYAVDAGTFVASTLGLALIRSRSLSSPGRTRSSPLRDLGDGWRAVRSRAWLLTYCAHVALLNAIAVSPFLVLGPLVAQRHLGGATAWSALAVSYAVGGLAGNSFVLRWQPAHPLRTAFVASLAMSPLLALLAFTSPLWSLIPAALMAGVQAAIYNTLSTATIQSNVPMDLQSRVSSFVSIGGLAAVPVGFTLAGSAASSFGTRTVFVTAAAWVILSAAGALSVPSIRASRSTR
jgi:MFS family permease